MVQNRNVKIIVDSHGNQIVVINDIVFKGKRSIKWDEVEKYLEQYVGEFFEVAESKDIIYIGTELPDEYTRSNYTYGLNGANAKAKANAAQAIPEIIEIAVGKSFTENKKNKHNNDAKYGWYHYCSRFALPVFGDNGELARYNVFHALLIVRYARNQKLYLYDIIEIKKETSNLFQSDDFTQ